MVEEEKITIEFNYPPVVYKIETNANGTEKALKKLGAFVRAKNKQVLEVAGDLAKLDPKARLKYLSKEIVSCRLPTWFYKMRIEVPDGIALILYFVGRPLTTGEITKIVNKEMRKIDLRNVSKHLTSKGKGLYGYTTYDDLTERYGLNDYGKSWIEKDLIPKFEGLSKLKKNGKAKHSKR